MQSKVTISYLTLAVYILMLAHAVIPHSHCLYLQQPAQISLTTDDNGHAHRLHHQMPRHTHPRCCEYYFLEADDTPVSLIYGVTPHVNCKPLQVPVPVIDLTYVALCHYVLPGSSNSFIAATLLRAPPTV